MQYVVLIKWSYSLPILLTDESRIVIIFWAHNPISFKHVSFGIRTWNHSIKPITTQI